MKTLKDLMDVELSELLGNKYKSIADFVMDDQKSAEFISSMMDEFPFDTPTESSTLYSVAQTRARHSAISFLMGLVFKKFGNLFDNLYSVIYAEPKRAREVNLKLWMMTSLNHDRAYTSERLTKADLDLRKTYDPFFLDETYTDDRLSVLNYFEQDYPKVSAYSSLTIKGYDKFSREYHTRKSKKENEIERIDHGILGGAILFKEMTNKYKKNRSLYSDELLIIKTSSLTIAQHNIYKSDKKETDKYYIKANDLEQLLSTSDFKICKETPLLLLLSLVDTLECVKRLSKESNKDGSLETLSVLSSIELEVTENKILIDFSKLYERILQKKNNAYGLMKAYSKHLNAIKSIHTWTEIACDTSHCSNNAVCLTIVPIQNTDNDICEVNTYQQGNAREYQYS